MRGLYGSEGVGLPIPKAGTVDVVAVGESSAQSDPFPTHCNAVRIVADVACYVAFGSNPTATTSSIRLPAGVVEYWQVVEGEKLAVIQDDTAGNLNVTHLV